MYIPGAFFSTELFWSGIKWLMIFGVWGMFAFGTWREDRKIREILNSKGGVRDTAPLLQALHRRDMQIWLQLSLLLIVVAANDIQHDAGLLPQDFFALPVPAPVVSNSNPVPDDKMDTALRKNNAQNLPFSDITEFNENNSKQEAYIDWLKQHYESWLVTFYYLQKCKAVSMDDYDVIRRSLEKELDSAHAQKTVEKNILTAAIGSYKEMYIDIACDSPNFASTKSLYDANMQQIKGSPATTVANPKPAGMFRQDNTH